jgi:hypothetical protein
MSENQPSTTVIDYAVNFNIARMILGMATLSYGIDDTAVNYTDCEPPLDSTCSICLDDKPEWCKTGCGHIFHKECISRILQPKCPQRI